MLNAGAGVSTSHLSCAGAGQDVGRSCILVSIAGKNVMLDCGMHMGFNDDVSPLGWYRALWRAYPACSWQSWIPEALGLSCGVGTVQWIAGRHVTACSFSHLLLLDSLGLIWTEQDTELL